MLLAHDKQYAIYRHPDKRRTIIPMHAGDLPRGTMRQILKDIGLTAPFFSTSRPN